ncbi:MULTISPECIES: ribonuclease domain-containing protein [unclassified Streptomyces]|uniref:ribonuclease domain-containing protein n=1 Tax=unclassified Streptomyces TaxID=2593676 RepID=UPI00036DBCB5|nr:MULTISPECIES: ribonuclease domain-containing protein [unclassified Streptomyces]MYT28727.1 guanine-specific ribonuclease N1 and T1 [Streptomyces sp. SID8354]
MLIHTAPRRAAAVLGALLAALLLVLTGCSTGGDGKGSSAPSHRPSATATAGGRPSGGAAPGWAKGLPTVPADRLPAEARRTLKLIDAGGPFPYPKDGTVFGNYEKRLPAEPRGYYHEYTVDTPGAKNRGARRLITGKHHEFFYTGDHYKSFQAVLR